MHTLFFIAMWMSELNSRRGKSSGLVIVGATFPFGAVGFVSVVLLVVIISGLNITQLTVLLFPVLCILLLFLSLLLLLQPSPLQLS